VPEYWRCTPAERVPLLQKAGVVDDQHAVRISEAFDHIITDIVTDPVDVPVRPPQQALHPVGAHLAGTLGQRPPVLAFQTRNQTRHLLAHPGPRFRAVEPAGDPLVNASNSAATSSTTTRQYRSPVKQVPLQ
jgi:hypothetical protein